MAEFVSKFDTLRWRDGRLEMIDQRVLPAEIRYLAFDSALALADGIRDMVVRGAPAIGCAAAYGVALDALRLQDKSSAEFNRELGSAFCALAASRPTAVNLFWALARMRRAWEACRDTPPAQSAQRLLEEAHAIFADDVAANRSMGRHGAELIADGATILTHCNAGALATAGHGTALILFAIQMALGGSMKRTFGQRQVGSIAAAFSASSSPSIACGGNGPMITVVIWLRSISATGISAASCPGERTSAW